MSWFYSIPILIVGIILGPIVYRVDDWAWPKFLAALRRHWKVLATLIVGIAVGGYLASAFFDFAASEKAWEWGWDALVALGTMALALVTSATVLSSYFQESHRMRKENIGAVNHVIFELARTYNKFYAIKVQLIEPHIAHLMRHLEIQPAIGLIWTPPEIDYRSLLFLFEHGDPNILGTLSLLQQEAASTIEMLRDRNRVMLEVIQPAVEQLTAGAAHGRYDALELERVVGIRRITILKNLTNAMIDGTENFLRTAPEEIEKLRAAAKAIYPDSKIGSMTVPARANAAQ